MVHHQKVGGDLIAEADTIAAISTPAGIGGIGIIRVSGPKASDLARAVTRRDVVARQAIFSGFFSDNGSLIDEGVLLFFPAPGSYTGEDVCEFQCHGSPVVLNVLVSRLQELGARLADPGEYTRRAFLNGKLDLAQAEAVVDLINSSTAVAAQSAMRSLSGEFSERAHRIVEKIVNLRMFIEAAIDFPEEEIDFLANSDIAASISQIHQDLTDLIDRSTAGNLLREGITVVIAGRPNAGKSSLFNRLALQERAIVTPQPGTTRDTVDVTVDVSGLAVRLVDTAGLRDVSDAIEKEGISRARQAMQSADIVLYVIDSEQGANDEDLKEIGKLDRAHCAVVWNKTDLIGDVRPAIESESCLQVHVSALTGLGMKKVYKIIKRIAGYEVNEEGLFLARRRHLSAMRRASEFVAQAHEALAQRSAGELAAQDLWDAMKSLDEITQTPSSDQLLGEIFANFCIGK
ncbi:MAG: tRNA uridine-5-carboxymethylaminomethyl(34) synthesis GTPase MnmE [Acidiferrobacterales bacterium]|nr:tRNA uridine-5-carboxymethylaminomethyl(34) synthesis GTPase MnmE [Acidiferrobacterales bacterium]